MCHFSRKKEKSVVSFTNEQNIICSQTQLDDIAHEQIIICTLLFAGHVVGFRPMKRKTNFLSNENLLYLHTTVALLASKLSVVSELSSIITINIFRVST